MKEPCANCRNKTTETSRILDIEIGGHAAWSRAISSTIKLMRNTLHPVTGQKTPRQLNLVLTLVEF